MKKFAILFSILILSAAAFDLRISHPHSGLRNALGSASSGIVVYKQTNQIEVGDKVVVKIESVDQSPVLAIVRSVSKTKIEIQSSSKNEVVNKNATYGKLVLMIPFLGTLFQVLGF